MKISSIVVEHGEEYNPNGAEPWIGKLDSSMGGDHVIVFLGEMTCIGGGAHKIGDKWDHAATANIIGRHQITPFYGSITLTSTSTP